MNIVDSSGWLEYFADSPRADLFAEVIENASDLLIPVISLYEVFRVVEREKGSQHATDAILAMQQGTVIDLNTELVLFAAQLASSHRLPLADSLIYATAQAQNATLYTQDAHFKDLPGVMFFEKT